MASAASPSPANPKTQSNHNVRCFYRLYIGTRTIAPPVPTYVPNTAPTTHTAALVGVGYSEDFPWQADAALAAVVFLGLSFKHLKGVFALKIIELFNESFLDYNNGQRSNDKNEYGQITVVCIFF